MGDAKLPKKLGSDYFMGVDIGTSSCKVSLFDMNGKPVLTSTQAYPILNPRPSWSEQDSAVILKSVLSAIRNVTNSWSAGKISGIGLGGHVNTLIPIDKNGKPISACLGSMDKRAVHEVELINREIGEKTIYNITKTRPQPKHLAPKILWLRDNLPTVYERTYKFLQLKDFVEFELTGNFFTDFTSAPSTLLFDLERKQWSHDLAMSMGISVDRLPIVGPPTEIVGGVTDEAAKKTGLRAGTPVVAGMTDDLCDALGVGSMKPGVAFEKAGTTSLLNIFTDNPNHGNPVPLASNTPLNYLTFVNHGTGAVLRWFIEQFCEIESIEAKELGETPYSLMDEKAQLIKQGSDELIFLPSFIGQGDPEPEPTARGAIFGLTFAHTKPHVYRAILESVAFCLKRNLDYVKKLGVTVNEIRSSGGGANSKLWRQIKADVIGLPMLMSSITDAGTLGAAILAKVGTGFFPGDAIELAENMVTLKDIRKPCKKTHIEYEKAYRLYDHTLKKIIPGLDSILKGY